MNSAGQGWTRWHSCWPCECCVPRPAGETPHGGSPLLPPSRCMPGAKGEGELFCWCSLWISIKNLFTQKLDGERDCAVLCCTGLLRSSREMAESSNPTLWNGARDRLVVMKTTMTGARGALWLAVYFHTKLEVNFRETNNWMWRG